MIERRGTGASTPNSQRRLAAIFSADVAGYTRLMKADEAGTLRLLTSHREMTDRLIELHSGRIANTAGDSVLAEFPSVVDALQCALKIQERIAAVHQEVPAERQVSFRIGLHVGEVMVRGGDLFGDGVNIAARVQTLAGPGAVCLSATAYEHVHRAVSVELEDLGLQTVKNIDTPIRVYLARPLGSSPAAELPAVHRDQDIFLVRRLFNVILKAIREAEQAVGLAFLEAPVLSSVQDKPGIDVREVAKWLDIEVAKTRRLLTHLERRNLIARAEPTSSGGRGWVLTNAGHEVRERLRPLATAAQDRVMATLSEAERSMFQAMIARLLRANERADD